MYWDSESYLKLLLAKQELFSLQSMFLGSKIQQYQPAGLLLSE